MAERLEIIEGSKAEKYEALLPQIQSVVEDEPDLIACMANVAAMLHETFHFWWTGFYRVVNNGNVNGNDNGNVWSSERHQAGLDGQVATKVMRRSHNNVNDNPKDAQQLVLGPFQGPLACTRIRWGRGVCGTAWAEDRTVVVPDVSQFPGHIACSAASRSEIVVPLHDAQGHVCAVLDIDSAELATFDDTDRKYLEQIANLLNP